MSDPRYRMDRPVAAPPDAVLAAIHAAALKTNRSTIPASIRGVRGMRATVRGQRFTVALDEIYEGDVTDLHGWVVPAGEHGWRVQASVADDRNAGAVVAGLLVVAAAMVLLGADGAWWFVGFVAVIGISAALRRAAAAMDHTRAAFLVAWLNRVLDGMDAPPRDDRPGGYDDVRGAGAGV